MKIENIYKFEGECVITDIGTYQRYNNGLWFEPLNPKAFASKENEALYELKYQEYKQANAYRNNNPVPTYEYYLKTWGGFYNEEYSKIHGKRAGDFWFRTAEDRQQYVDELKRLENELGVYQLVIWEIEGFCTRIPTILHRVVEWNGQKRYSTYELGLNFPLKTAEYHMECKWLPGFNDYPFGEEFDYETNDIKIIQEWITGAYCNFDFEDRPVLFGS